LLLLTAPPVATSTTGADATTLTVDEEEVLPGVKGLPPPMVDFLPCFPGLGRDSCPLRRPLAEVGWSSSDDGGGWAGARWGLT